MHAAIIFTGSGPLLILTSYRSLEDPHFIKKLSSKGIQKFIGYELPIETVKEKYGALFQTIMNDVRQTDDLRVLDYNGHHVFYNFSFKDLGNPILFEST
ncbi:MAG: hypothetical protein E4H13_05080 [Calditrichales bacterium]|nr:MAG: hypothetical protein E4H13_05080 [Calditrichales bacterium]